MSSNEDATLAILSKWIREPGGADLKSLGCSEMVSGVKKQIDKSRLTADLVTAKVDLLSAQCAADRIRLQHSIKDIVAFADRQALKQAIASAEALHRFFSDLGAHIKNEEGDAQGNR